MNFPQPVPRLLVCCAVGLRASCGQDSLGYQFRLGETNAYRVQIELTAEGVNAQYDGHVLLYARRLEEGSGNAVLALRGSLSVTTEPVSTPMPYRPPMVPRPLSFPSYAELQVDPMGRVLAEAGDVPLPLQAGRLGASLFLPLPPGAGNVVESQAEVSLPDDTPRPGMPWRPPYYDGPMFARNPSASLRATHTLRVEAASVTPESARLTWKATLQSWLRFEDAPLLDAVSHGEAILDHHRGLLREIRFHYRETDASETVTRRSRLVFEARLLEGDERVAALNHTAPRTPQTLTAAEVRAALAELGSQDAQRRAEALAKLQGDNLGPLPADLAALAEPLLNARDESVRGAAARILAAAATTEQVPTLLSLLRQPESPARTLALQALGRLRDPRGIAPLVEFVARGENERFAAIEALKQFGPEAEEPVLGLFAEKNLETRRAACQILEQLGTQRSLDTLREAMLDTDRQLRDLASQAVGAIAGRGR